MRETTSRAAEVEAFILQSVPEHPRDIARLTAERFGVSRQAVNNHLKRLVDEGKLVASGATRSRSYAPAILARDAFELQVSAKLKEDRVWSERVAPLIKGTPKNVEDICHYAFTEVFDRYSDKEATMGSRGRVCPSCSRATAKRT